MRRPSPQEGEPTERAARADFRFDGNRRIATVRSLPAFASSGNRITVKRDK
jgi:hypothetical protein